MREHIISWEKIAEEMLLIPVGRSDTKQYSRENLEITKNLDFNANFPIF